MRKIDEKGYPWVQYVPKTYDPDTMLERSKALFDTLSERRSIREFSDRPVPLEVIENIIKTAGSAPSGANMQPWTFCVVSDPEIKSKIREAAEKEEHDSYTRRMSQEWLKDLEPLGTDWHKPFLEIAPYLIVVFKKLYGKGESDKKKQHYYVSESVGLACGMLLAAIQNAGLASLTHTPSPMRFLSKILNRPENEKPFLLIPIGYPADEVFVPDISRKDIDQIMVKY